LAARFLTILTVFLVLPGLFPAYANTEAAKAVLVHLSSPDKKDVATPAAALAGQYAFEEMAHELLNTLKTEIESARGNSYLVMAVLKSLGQIGTQTHLSQVRTLSTRYEQFQNEGLIRSKSYISAEFDRVSQALLGRRQNLPSILLKPSQRQVLDPKIPEQKIFEQKKSNLESAPRLEPSPRSIGSISVEEFESTLGADRLKVPEFQYVAEAARSLGLRVWLFGGTASGFVHYSKWNLLRLKGDHRYQGDRFDFDFTNIYRSTQDLDIVADGSIQQIDKLQALLQEKYPHFLGDKDAKWEVRSLQHARGSAGQVGYKEALLGDFDFNSQNSDSNSVGLVELTDSKEPIVRDLREWDQRYSRFFVDSINGQIHFIRSPLHFQTSRAKRGDNPEIFSVIRALTKAFQYELTFPAEDMAEMKKIVDAFDPQSRISIDGSRRLNEIGVKLFKHAVNIELAWNTLESMGLRKKLMQVPHSQKGTAESVAFWMNKEPLRSKPLGNAMSFERKRTAKDLGIDIVAHETDSFLSYESITRAHTGDPNVFVSRANQSGEAARFGEGFYTRRGHIGARGTGLTIRSHLNPDAVLDEDFKIVNNDFVLILNKKAITVIPESLNLTRLEYFQILNSKDFESSDRALVEKFKRKLRSTIKIMSSAEEKELVDYLKSVEKWSKQVAEEWLNLHISARYPEFDAKVKIHPFVFSNYLTKSGSESRPDLIKTVDLRNLSSDRPDALKFLLLPHWKAHRDDQFSKYVAYNDNSFMHSENERRSLRKSRTQAVLEMGWVNKEAFLSCVNFERYDSHATLKFAVILSQEGWAQYPELLELLFKKGRFEQKYKSKELEVLKLSDQTTVRVGDSSKSVMSRVLKEPQWSNHPALIAMLDGKEVNFENLYVAFKNKNLSIERYKNVILKPTLRTPVIRRCEAVFR